MIFRYSYLNTVMITIFFGGKLGILGGKLRILGGKLLPLKYPRYSDKLSAVKKTKVNSFEGNFRNPRRVALRLPSHSPRVCTGGTRTLMSEPKFLGSINYQICLPMVLRKLRYKMVKSLTQTIRVGALIVVANLPLGKSPDIAFL